MGAEHTFEKIIITARRWKEERMEERGRESLRGGEKRREEHTVAVEGNPINVHVDVRGGLAVRAQLQYKDRENISGKYIKRVKKF